MKVGYIYFVACEPMEAVKIGFTSSGPISRVNVLQTGCPSPLKLLTYVPGSMEEEKLLHMAFQPLHIHGEWFRYELKLRDLVNTLLDEGCPTDRGFFEDILHDATVGAGYCHPDTPEPIAAAHAASCDWSALRSII